MRLQGQCVPCFRTFRTLLASMHALITKGSYLFLKTCPLGPLPGNPGNTVLRLRVLSVPLKVFKNASCPELPPQLLGYSQPMKICSSAPLGLGRGARVADLSSFLGPQTCCRAPVAGAGAESEELSLRSGWRATSGWISCAPARHLVALVLSWQRPIHFQSWPLSMLKPGDPESDSSGGAGRCWTAHFCLVT